MTLIDLYQEIEALPASMSVALGKDYCEGMRTMKNWVLDIIASALAVEREQGGSIMDGKEDK